MAISQHLSPMVGTRAEVRSAHGVVSAGHSLAVEAGLGALEQGGNAIDAVIAGAFAAFVAEPNNAGIAGYGHLSAFLADDASFLTVDHGPRAPARARDDMFEIEAGPLDGHDWPSVSGGRNFVGHLAPAVPGAVAGLWEAHQRAGRLDWASLLEPAIAIAEAGLEVTWVLLIEIAARLAEIEADPTLAAMLLPQGRLPRARTADDKGERLDQRALAETLRRIAREGPDALYRGAVAAAIGDTIAAGGGILSAEDLAGYAPKLMHEQPATYRGLHLVTANDTVGSEALGILEQFPLSEFGPGSVEHYHLLAEAMGHAFADNATLLRRPRLHRRPRAGARPAGDSQPPAPPLSISSEWCRARSKPRRRGWRARQPNDRRRSAAFTAPPRSWPATARATLRR